MYQDDTNPSNPVGNLGMGWDTPQYTAVVVIGAMLFLVMIRRGFRGVSLGGASLRVS
jgi:hypothetical protein